MLFRQHQTGDYKTLDSFDRVGDSNDCSLDTAVCCRETAGWRRKKQSRRQGVLHIGDDTPPSSFTEFFREFLTPLGYRIYIYIYLQFAFLSSSYLSLLTSLSSLTLGTKGYGSCFVCH